MFSDGDVTNYDAWLLAYAEAMLEMHAGHMSNYGLPPHLIELEIREIRNVLTAVVLHWKAQGRRCFALRQEEFAGAQLSSDTAKSAGPNTGPPDGKHFRDRAAWLQDALDKRKWTVRDLERNGGPCVQTLRRVLAGQPVRDTVLEKLAQALSGKGRVRVSDIPGQ